MGSYNVKIMEYKNGHRQAVVYDCPIDVIDCAESVERVSPERYIQLEDGFEVNPSTGEIRDERERERCIQSSLSRTKNKIYDIANSEKWKYFLTLTFSSEYVDRYDYKACLKKLQGWLDNLRRVNPEMKYVFVPECHKDGAFHFHGLMTDCVLPLAPSPHKDVFNLETYKWGFTTVSLVKDTICASNYITKYITKDLMCYTKNQRRYVSSQNISDVKIKKRYVSVDEIDSFIKKQGNVEYSRNVSSNIGNIQYVHFADLDK